MNISLQGLSLIKFFEGFKALAYWDTNGRVWTIGYGETQNVAKGQVTTEPAASIHLAKRIHDYEKLVLMNIKVPLAQCQFDALVSFTYNEGVKHDLYSAVNTLNPKAPDVFLEYVYAGPTHHLLAGLVNRREMERKLFMQAPWPPLIAEQKAA